MISEPEEIGGVNVTAKLTALRTDKDETKAYDVVISTPDKKSDGTVFEGSSPAEGTQTLEDVDPNSVITVHLIDRDTGLEVKTMDIPIRDLHSNLTSTQIIYDGITVLVEYEVTRDGKKVSSTEDKLDDIITTLGFADKPWYLETVTVYSTMTLSLMRIFVTTTTAEIAKNSQGAAFTVIDFLKSSTEMVKKLTINRRAFTLADAEALIEQVDTYVHSGLHKFDFTTDQVRAQLAEALLDFRQAVSHQVALAKELKEKNQAKLEEITTAKVAELKTAGSKFVDSAKNVLEVFKEKTSNLNLMIILAHKYSRQYIDNGKQIIDSTKASVEGKVKEISTGYKVLLSNYVNKKITANSSWKEILTVSSIQATTVALQKAQPYVHQAVAFSTPYIEKILNMSRPYLDKAAPYAATLTDNIMKQVEANPTADKLVKNMTAMGLQGLEAAQAYAIPPEAKK